MRHGYPVVARCAECRRMTRQTLVPSDDHMETLICWECGDESTWPAGSPGIKRTEEAANGERLGDVVPR